VGGGGTLLQENPVIQLNPEPSRFRRRPKFWLLLVEC